MASSKPLATAGDRPRRRVRRRPPTPLGRRLSRLLRSSVIYLILIAVSAFFVAPFLWMVSGSLKSLNETFAIPPHLLPQQWKWSNYPQALTYVPFARYFLNSALICTGSVIGTVISCSLVAYSLSRVRWFGRNILFAVVLASMMLPAQVTMIPVFVMFRRIGWVGTFAPLIVPSFFGNAFFIFLVRQFFMTIPEELLDAARIDGASQFHIYSRIMLPLSVPVLATVGLFTFFFAWNDFLGPLIYLTKEEMWTIAIGLQGFQSQHGWRWELLMAASVVFAAPTVLLYLLAQRFFVRSIVATGIR